MDLKTAYEAIKISSGNSFVHETESQVILNGSYNISFTMDLAVKDMGFFDALSKKHHIPLEVSPVIFNIFKEGQKKIRITSMVINDCKKIRRCMQY